MLWLQVLLFILSRLYHLAVVPPFMDEMIYIRWLSQISANNDWLVPLKEFGWEPLQIWSAAIINRFIADPLLSLRINSVFISGLGLLLVKKLFGNLAAWLYLLSPMILVHDRLGMRGDQLVVLASLLVYWGLKSRILAKNPVFAWLIGAGLAVGLTAKTTAAFLPILVLGAYIGFRPKLKWPDLFGGIIALLPILFYYFSGTLNLVIAKQATFLGGVAVLDNFGQVLLWLVQYLTWPIGLLVILGLIINRKNYLLMGVILLPLILLVGTAKILFPRYLLPVMPFILAAAAAGLAKLGQSLPRLFRPCIIVFFGLIIWFNFKILTNLPAAPMPEIDQWQYVTGWPSGYGVKELAGYLNENNLSVFVPENNDLLTTGLKYYQPELVYTLNATSGDYLVTNIDHEGVRGEMIKEFARPNQKSAIKLWRLE